MIHLYFNQKCPQVKQIPFWLILSLVYTIHLPIQNIKSIEKYAGGKLLFTSCNVTGVR